MAEETKAAPAEKTGQAQEDAKQNSKKEQATNEAALKGQTVKKREIEHISATAGPVNIIELLDSIVFNALKSKASDVHMEPQESELLIRFRVDGILREVLTIDKNLEQALIFKIKVSAKLRTDEHFAPQDGRIRFIFDGKKLDTRVSILPITRGEKVVMRLLTSAGRSFKLQDLGLRDNELEAVEKAYNKPYGMILAVGPKGSGKTTTLYSILKILNSTEVNITTVEDPVEYDLEGVNHIQINTKANLTFASGLRSILRQDPDIIMVGEIRDAETARIATNAALTGHLVLSTLHTNDAVTAIPRLIDMGIEDFLVASTVNLVIAQRLARKLCDECKKEFTLTKADLEQLTKMRPDIAALLKPEEKLYHEVGCNVCDGTGFKGRVGLYEVFDIDESIRKLITEHASVDDIYEQARKNGLVLIVEDGVKKLKAGVTGVSELIRVTALKE
ncbi:MAG: Type II secretion system protein E [candidate division WS6 bacterium OLB20]|uniref:Type II secretion system protein E n=1 Tax=candidate division WS6 bacterium OLB20 TaxID=1617426 RepID=A0A136M0L1_9BACT|nr:MAG: Type II secretion system protein E [candidate division WS6 bacterium OLB20]